MPPSAEQKQRLKQIESSSPLRSLSDADKTLVFNSRDFVAEHPKLLPRLVESVDWSDARQVCAWSPFTEHTPRRPRWLHIVRSKCAALT